MPFGHSKDITGLMVFVICGGFFLGCSTVSQVHFTKGIRDHEGLFFGDLAKDKNS